MSRRRQPPGLRILAVDPGPTDTAWVVLADSHPILFAKEPNETALANIISLAHRRPCVTLAIEMIASYGMPVGAEVFETCTWIGRFEQAWVGAGGTRPLRIPRKDACLHICNSPRANDATIRQALIDRYGGSTTKAIGTKAAPGPLYKMNVDHRAALAVGLTALETGAAP